MLQGIKIVEICGIGPGPFSAMHLADLGAEVIAVERADDGRVNLLNRGKRSVLANLKTPEGRELVLRLIEDADALIEGMRPGVMERLGLGPKECLARNPRLVYGRMTGWGQQGPMAQAAGHDNNYAALSGALFHNGTADTPPSSLFATLGDIAGGALYLTIGLLSAIIKARTSGEGAVVDAAIVDGSAHMLQLMLSTRNVGYMGDGRGNNMHDSSPFYATYRCADGGFVTLGSIEPQFHALLLEKLGLQGDSRFASQWDRGLWPEQRQHFTELFASRVRDYWCALLEGTDVCFAPVLAPHEAATHPHLLARETYFTRDELLQTRVAPRFNGQVVTPGEVPKPGAHTEQVLAALDAKASVWKTG
ncbi:CoA transferase [Pseudomonas sp. JQ170]|uniref:CaiB/BaiF CoA transferase family protein n=1 Tax=unclassified Pseudomonas TaxID=196821 RepID=UPI002655C3B0|nr:MULTISPECIES: CaiB/BaiF CoA-transferase family protein [unclassified Pseudomonas]MDN7139863.1 CoA transferase [Pseudomonas sp. JQ170]WRO73683.1 CaiB/BaiF CoA-transferase family protein [Pseudomonas sp. 170C]